MEGPGWAGLGVVVVGRTALFNYTRHSRLDTAKMDSIRSFSLLVLTSNTITTSATLRPVGNLCSLIWRT